jgi:hypothetical protein
VRNSVPIHIFIVLIGTRWNSPDRIVTREEGGEAVRGFGIPYFEMSAETGEGVEDGFLTMVTKGIRRISNFFDSSE